MRSERVGEVVAGHLCVGAPGGAGQSVANFEGREAECKKRAGTQWKKLQVAVVKQCRTKRYAGGSNVSNGES